MNEISNKWIGKNTIRPDGAEKVTGRAQYSSDTTMPGMIWGHVLRSQTAKIRIRSQLTDFLKFCKQQHFHLTACWTASLW